MTSNVVVRPYKLEPYPQSESFELERQARESWTIKNTADLSFGIDALANAEHEKARVQAIYDAGLARLMEYREREMARIENGASYMRSLVEAYCEDHKHELLGTGKRKSVEFPTGTVSWRSVPAKLKVEDRDALTAWLLEAGPESGLYRARIEPEMSKLQEHFRTTGEVPSGCVVDPGEERLYVKPASEAIVPVEDK